MSLVTRAAPVAMLLIVPATGRAQSADAPLGAPQHDHAAMSSAGWHFSQDGVAFLTYNHQGGSRGGDEFVSQNWWMGMFGHKLGSGTLSANVMLSLQPATVGGDGYREIFQVGEAFHDVAVIDHQHPYDFLMQAALVWKRPFADRCTLTVAGGPVGEAALGPVAYMHRASAAESPTAPLSHHTLDSTHISMGVVTGGVERGPWSKDRSSTGTNRMTTGGTSWIPERSTRGRCAAGTGRTRAGASRRRPAFSTIPGNCRRGTSGG